MVSLPQRAGLKSHYEGRMVLRARQFSGQNGINCENSEESASFITEHLLHPDSVRDFTERSSRWMI